MHIITINPLTSPPVTSEPSTFLGRGDALALGAAMKRVDKLFRQSVRFSDHLEASLALIQIMPKMHFLADGHKIQVMDILPEDRVTKTVHQNESSHRNRSHFYKGAVKIVITTLKHIFGEGCLTDEHSAPYSSWFFGNTCQSYEPKDSHLFLSIAHLTIEEVRDRSKAYWTMIEKRLNQLKELGLTEEPAKKTLKERVEIETFKAPTVVLEEEIEKESEIAPKPKISLDTLIRQKLEGGSLSQKEKAEAAEYSPKISSPSGFGSDSDDEEFMGSGAQNLLEHLKKSL